MRLFPVATILFLTVQAAAGGEIRVVTSTPNLAYLASRIGGRQVEVFSVMRGPEDVHNVVARPSHMMKMRKADLFIHSGLDGEPWVPQLIKGARNSKLLVGQPGNVDASKGILLKQVPTRGKLSRALGDIHVYGNPHYLLDPLNGITVAGTIAEALQRADPQHAELFKANLEALEQEIRAFTADLEERLKPYQGARVATYHRSWVYFLERFGLEKVAEVEPKPGISPGPQHLAACIDRMKSNQAKIVIVETYNSKKNADFVAAKVGGQSVVLAMEIDSRPEIQTYEELFRYDVDALLAAFQATGQSASAITGE